LALAVERDNIAAVELLIASNGSVNCLDYNGCTPLMIASRLGHDDILRVLLAAGASIFTRDKAGYSGMGHAAEAGQVNALKRLLDYGASALVHHHDGVIFSLSFI
jgi:ankyrin repeat protein